ncbi:hypothetical protein DFH07DRAFT_804567 [Mycena maculata]|uniref:Right handed beta helix domain-containing protein n=1 Tax=Mycena maculata TaxID=230809 RepID=A0AAD7JUT7_9AGAR|nr:hypothetical protein DFH07DRAFT_804567 [Mycena maculata]
MDTRAVTHSEPTATAISGAQKSSCVDPEPSETVSERINTLLHSSGPGYILSLCPSEHYYIQSPLVFAAADQEISTAGYPLGHQRASLIVSGPDHTVAVDGTRPGCSGAMLRNIQINGNRGNAPPMPGGANVVFGGVNENQTIQYVRSYDPRSWSCIHLTEGDLSCRNVTVQNNDIGPCGAELLDEWADGISVSCQNSVVRNNLVMNPTDGGIVVFGSPGTQVYNNTIWVTNQTLLGGINMVDYLPWDGNYTDTVVRDNTIIGGYADAGGGTSGTSTVIKIGIAIGPRTWFGDEYLDNITFAGTVTGNRLSGAFVYGIAMSSAENFTVQDNVMFDNYTFIGGSGPSCPFNGDAVPAPAAFIYDTTTSTVSVQSDFQLVTDGDSLTCTLPPDGGDYWPYGKSPTLSLENLISSNTSTCDISTSESCLVAPPPNNPFWSLDRAAYALVLAAVAWYLWTLVLKRLRRRRLSRTGRHKRTRTYVGQIPITTEVLGKGIPVRQEPHVGKRRVF